MYYKASLDNLTRVLVLSNMFVPDQMQAIDPIDYAI